jgi:hypothetical protein
MAQRFQRCDKTPFRKNGDNHNRANECKRRLRKRSTPLSQPGFRRWIISPSLSVIQTHTRESPTIVNCPTLDQYKKALNCLSSSDFSILKN